MKVNDETYKYYFYFIQERMSIFWKRYNGKNLPFSDDPIFQKYKFTNVYRAQDRVSQYLIKNVIQASNSELNEIDVLLRILVFKVFNRIETWEYLENTIGEINLKSFDVERISKVLTERIKNQPIFSPAYMMTGSHSKYNTYTSKHEKWLQMIKAELIKEKKFDKIITSKSLKNVYEILLSCSFIGEFLAYQYAIDFNYSDVINFDENSFVKAGIGAIRGIKKCFGNSSKYSFEDCIQYTQNNFKEYQTKYGYSDFIPLFGRELKLIDLQNCFCETDKYLRAKMPELIVGNKRIKQKFSQSKENLSFYFPTKWDINKKLNQCTFKNSQELTLF